ncbi:hypothetical protein FHS70_004816 [Flammeovirga yaeyamensis]|nr:hypothetical protein [Flammeovirga yaeyamensis]
MLINVNYYCFGVKFIKTVVIPPTYLLHWNMQSEIDENYFSSGLAAKRPLFNKSVHQEIYFVYLYKSHDYD